MSIEHGDIDPFGYNEDGDEPVENFTRSLTTITPEKFNEIVEKVSVSGSDFPLIYLN